MGPPARSQSPSPAPKAPKAAAPTASAAAASTAASRGAARGLRHLRAVDLQVGEQIGKGTFKQVHRGLLQDPAAAGGAREVVVLRFVKDKAETARELEVLALLAQDARSPPFVPRIFGAVDEKKALVVLQDRALLGSLKTAFTDPDLGPALTMTHKLYAAAQVSDAMGFLQSLRLVHADLSCRNVLLCNLEVDPSSVLVKLTDFGLALVMKEGTDFEICKQPQATRWCAPETVARQKLSFHSDVWALGTTLWELFSHGDLPWRRFEKRGPVGDSLRALADNQEGAEAALPEEFPAAEGIPAAAHAAVLSCLKVDEEARPRPAHLGMTFLRIATFPDVTEDDMSELQMSPQNARSPTADTATSSSSGQWLSFMSKKPKEGVEPETQGPMTMEFLVQRLAEHLEEAAGQDRAVAHLAAELTQRLPKPLLAQLTQRLAEGAPPAPPAQAGRMLRDMMLPLCPRGMFGGALEAGVPLPRSVWTLRTLQAGGLRYREFADEHSAWTAFGEAGEAPSMLRDPSGADAASRNWVVVARCATPALALRPSAFAPLAQRPLAPTLSPSPTPRHAWQAPDPLWVPMEPWCSQAL